MKKQNLIYFSKVAAAVLYYLVISFPIIVSAAQVTLEWNANNPAPDGYRIFQRQAGNSYNYNTYTSVSGSSHTVGGLTAGVTYYFVVRAYQGDDESSDSNEVSYSPQGSIPPVSDSDGDGVIDAVDAFPNDPDEWIDTDSDGIGNNADIDDDNDGMPDTWELLFGLNPIVDDSQQDLDGDTISNIDEYLGNSDPSQVLGNLSPAMPILVSPENGILSGLTPTLITEGYHDEDGDVHLGTSYQIATDSAFAALVFERTSELHLTSLTLTDLVLDPDTTYFWRVKYIDERNAASVWSAPSSFTTIDYDTAGDSNANGLLDNQEITTAIDLDQDGTADIDQAGILCLESTDSQNPYLAIKRNNSNVQVVAARGYSLNGLALADNRPASMTGVLSFKLYLDDASSAISVTVYLSNPAPVGSKWYKYDIENGWYVYPNAIFSNDRKSVTLLIEDGGAGDLDGTKNGVIIDPAGLGYSSSQSGDSSSNGSDSSGESGCFIAASLNYSKAEITLDSAMTFLAIIFGLFVLLSTFRFRRQMK